MTLLSGKKVGVSQEEKELPYFKYYQQKLAEIPSEKLDLLAEPSETSAVSFEDRNLFLSGNDKDFCQIGYGVAENGTGFVCNETFMPGVRSEMLDWWFPWHSVGSDLRYKIWDPEDHYFARAEKADYVCDPSIPIKEKTWGINHYILEDIGDGPTPLILHFMNPVDFGCDKNLIGTPACESMVCAVGAGDCAAAMIHKWYPFKDGVMFCSRFWIGYARKDNQIACALPPGAKVPETVAKGLFAHNIKEFTNLAAILPDVYEENKDSF